MSPEQPPMMPNAQPEKPLEEMTIEELERKVEDMSKEINELLDRSSTATDKGAIKALQTMISKKTAERVPYILRRGELLQSKKGEEGV